MQPPVSLIRNGHTIALKWHRGRKRPGDTPFTATRIAAGMAAGASIEIDLQIIGDGNLAVLHDPLLEQSTTGSGAVSTASADTIRASHFIDAEGKDSGEPVMLLSDLAAIIAKGPTQNGALLQLDFKDLFNDFHDNTAALFAEAVAPVARHMILSGGDAKAVKHLGARVPDLPIGYDPCLEGAMERALKSGDYARFTAQALETAPWASMIYLHYELVLAADSAGYDMIGAFHDAGKTVDAWTIRRVDAQTMPAITRLIALNVDQITTDDAEQLFARFA